VGHSTHLCGRGESRASASTQTGVLELVDQRLSLTPLAAAAGKRWLAMDREVLTQAHRAFRGHRPQQPWQAGGGSLGERGHRLAFAEVA
jgi:hypothetical protein